MTEIRNHFRCAAGEIDRRNVGLGQPIDQPVRRLPGHDFLPLRSGVHVAMDAGEVAKLADVDLKDLGLRVAKRQRVLSQFSREAVVLRQSS